MKNRENKYCLYVVLTLVLCSFPTVSLWMGASYEEDKLVGMVACGGESRAVELHEASDSWEDLLEAAEQNARSGEWELSRRLLDIVRNYLAHSPDQDIQNRLTETENQINEYRGTLPQNEEDAFSLLEKARSEMEDNNFENAQEKVFLVKSSEIYDNTPAIQQNAQDLMLEMKGMKDVVESRQEQAEKILQSAEEALVEEDFESAKAYLDKADEMEIVQKEGDLKERKELLRQSTREREQELAEGREQAHKDQILNESNNVLVLAGKAIEKREFSKAAELIKIVKNSLAYDLEPEVAERVNLLENQLTERQQMLANEREIVGELFAKTEEFIEQGEWEDAESSLAQIRNKEIYILYPEIKEYVSLLEDTIRAHEADLESGILSAMQELADAEDQIMEYNFSKAEELLASVGEMPEYEHDRVESEVERIKEKLEVLKEEFNTQKTSLLADLEQAEASIEKYELEEAAAALSQVKNAELFSKMPSVQSKYAVVSNQLQDRTEKKQALVASQKVVESLLADIKQYIENARFAEADRLMARVMDEPALEHYDELNENVIKTEKLLAEAEQKFEEESALIEELITEGETHLENRNLAQLRNTLRQIRSKDTYHLSDDAQHKTAELEAGFIQLGEEIAEQRETFFQIKNFFQRALSLWEFENAENYLNVMSQLDVVDTSPALQNEVENAQKELEQEKVVARKDVEESEKLLRLAQEKMSEYDFAAARNSLMEAKDLAVYERKTAVQNEIDNVQATLQKEERQTLKNIEEALAVVDTINEKLNIYRIDRAETLLETLKESYVYSISEEVRTQVDRLERKKEAAIEDIQRAREEFEFAFTKAETAVENQEFDEAEALLNEVKQHEMFMIVSNTEEKISSLSQKLAQEKSDWKDLKNSKHTVELSLEALNKEIDEGNFENAKSLLNTIKTERAYNEYSQLREETAQLESEYEKAEHEAYVRELEEQAFPTFELVNTAMKSWRLEEAKATLNSLQQSQAYELSETIKAEYAEYNEKLKRSEKAEGLWLEAKEAFEAGNFPLIVEKIGKYKSLDVEVHEKFDVEAERMLHVAESTLEKYENLFDEGEKLLAQNQFQEAKANFQMLVEADIDLPHDLAQRAAAKLPEIEDAIRSKKVSGAREALEELEAFKRQVAIDIASEAFEEAQTAQSKDEYLEALEKLNRAKRELEKFNPPPEIREKLRQVEDTKEKVERKLAAYEEIENQLEAAESLVSEKDISRAHAALEKARKIAEEMNIDYTEELTERENTIKARISEVYRVERSQERERYLEILDQIQKQLDGGNVFLAQELYGIIDNAEKMLFTEPELTHIQSIQRDVKNRIENAEEDIEDVNQQFKEARRLLEEDKGIEALSEFQNIMNDIFEDNLPTDTKIEIAQAYLESLKKELPAALEKEAQRLRESAQSNIEHVVALKPYYLARFWVQNESYDVAKDYLQIVAEDQRLEENKRSWAAGELEDIETKLNRLEEEELLAVQEKALEAKNLMKEANDKRRAGENQKALQLRRLSEGLQVDIVVERAQMALNRNAFPVVRDTVERNIDLLQPHTQRKGVRKIVDIANAWSKAENASERVIDALQEHDLSAMENAYEKLKSIDIRPFPFDELIPHLDGARRSLMTLESPEQMLASLPGNEILQDYIERMKREKMLGNAYIICATNYVRGDLKEASDYALRVINHAHDNHRIEKRFAENVYVDLTLNAVQEGINEGQLNEAAHLMNNIRATSVYSDQRDVRNKVDSLTLELRKAEDRREAEKLLSKAEGYLLKNELELASGKLQKVRELSFYPELEGIPANVNRMAQNLQRRRRVAGSMKEKAEDVREILSSVEEKVNKWEFENASSLLAIIKDITISSELTGLKERIEEVQKYYESEKSVADSQLKAAFKELDETENILKDQKIDEAASRLENIRNKRVYKENYADFRDSFSQVEQKIDEHKKIKEAFDVIAEAEEEFLKGKLDEAEKILRQVKQTPEWMNIERVKVACNEAENEISKARQKKETKEEKIRLSQEKLDEALKAFNQQDYDAARAYLQKAEEDSGIAESPELAERKKSLSSRIENAEKMSEELWAMLENVRSLLNEGELDQAEHLLQDIKDIEIAAKIPPINNTLKELESGLELKRDEIRAEEILSELKENIEAGKYRQAYRMVIDAQKTELFDQMDDFRDGIQNLSAQIERVEDSARELYNQAVDAYKQDDVEKLRSLLDELEEKYRNTQVFAEKL